MNKLALLLVSGLIAFALVGCSGSMGGAGSTPIQPSNTQQPAVNDVPNTNSSAESLSDIHDKVDAGQNDGQETPPSTAADETASQPLSVESQELADVLSIAAQPIASNSGMDVGVAVIDLGASQRASINGGQQMYAASMIKLLIAATFMEQVDSGIFSLDDTYVLQAEDIVGGTGTLAGLGAGTAVTYGDLVTRMIDVSDNTAANVLIRAVGGMDVVNAKASALGLSKTQLNRYMMDEVAISQGIENYTSADDIATLLEMVYIGTLGTAESCEFIRNALRAQQDSSGIAQGLPAGTPFAHKTGTLSTVRHDGGVVEGSKPYVIVVMCGGAGFYEEGANATMSSIASAVNGHFLGDW